MKKTQTLNMMSVLKLLRSVHLSLLVLCLGGLSLSAQGQKTITGTVTSEMGETLPGVTILIKGSITGGVTDIDGNFSIQIPPNAETLVVSYTGMLTQEIPVGNNSSFNIVLKEDIQRLEELVVVGYGKQKKINLTGAVSSVKLDDELGDRPVANVTSMLQGVLPGLTISTSNSGGEPGAALNINIRGAGTLTGNGGQPYILVDGVPYGAEGLNSLNPNDIEDVTVLKDAASAAIYGSKGAYGVILINTKRGMLGSKTTVEYASNWAFSQPTLLPRMVNSRQAALMVNTSQINSGQTPWYTPERLQRIEDFANGLIAHEAGDYDNNGKWDMWGAGYANNNFYDLFFAKNAPRTKHDLSVRGGSQKTTYFLSGSFFEQDGALKFGKDKYSRFNFTADLSAKATDWLTLNATARYAKETTDFPSGGFGNYTKEVMYHQMSRSSPTNPLYNPNGDIIATDALRMTDAGREVNDKHTSFFKINAQFEPIENWVTTIGYNKNIISSFIDREEFAANVVHPDGTIVNQGYNPETIEKRGVLNDKDIFNAVTTYKFNIDETHNFSALAGYEQRLDKSKLVGGRRNQPLTSEVPTISTSIGDQYAFDQEGHFATQGIFGRITYDYKEKYLVEFNGRYDGSSYFSEGNKWGFFPSIAASYVVSKEDFFHSNFINTLKLRASWGSLGNHDPELANSYTPLMGNGTSQWLENGDQLVYVNAPGIISPTLTWETVTTTNFGLDLAFLNNRLTSTIEVYQRITSDMIGPSSVVPSILGASAPNLNNAELSTKGWEFSIAWRDRIGEDFSYFINFNIADNQAKITKYNNPEYILNGKYEGYTLGDIWAYTSVGLYQSDADAAAGPDQSKFYAKWQAGDMEYADLNKDGKIDNGSNTLHDHGDLSIIGNNRARYNYGFNLGASYKGIDLSLLFQGVGKRDYLFSSGTNLYYGFTGDVWQMSYIESATDYWTKENTGAFFPRPYNTNEQRKNTQGQTRYLEDASYLRLKNLQIGYTLPSFWLEKLGFINSVRVHASGENLWTKTNLNQNFDPETLGGGWGAGKIYPPSRVLSFGLNVTF